MTGQRIAIHQPNFLPWPGYFAKLAQADAFILLDDAQFSKNNIINRVRILGSGEPRWLTIPVSAHLGLAVNETQPARPDWSSGALSLLRNVYGKSAHFRAFWPVLEAWFAAAPAGNLASINTHFIVALAGHLGIATPLHNSSALGIEGRSDDRLVDIVRHMAPGGTYLSGRGGAGYQDIGKFTAAGLKLDFYRYTPTNYDQGQPEFQAGLSIIDALFHIGRDATQAMIHG